MRGARGFMLIEVALTVVLVGVLFALAFPVYNIFSVKNDLDLTENVTLHMLRRAQVHAQAILSNSTSPYRTLYRLSDEFSASMRHQEAEPGVVSHVIQQAMEAPRPKARYHANIPFSGEVVLHLGDSVWDLALRRMFKVDPSNVN